ncbi:uncharacterized protein [Palaemon carinicauda]|uniref:uncharacterized protein n=1 Tax=Palaemon carinicauda TaxID=392227 RepID=UPI0035B64EBC
MNLHRGKMTKVMWICTVVLVAVVSTSSALKCLKCSDCDNEPTTTSSCLPGVNHCMKSTIGGKIKKSCVPGAVCKLKDFNPTAINLLKTLKVFSDHDFKKMVSNTVHAKDKAIHCCETDFCNGSTDTRASLVVLVCLLPLLYFLGY